MKRTSLLILIALAVLFCGTGCTKKTADSNEVTCPVMNNKITKETAFATAEYNGKTYYLCCPYCKSEFAKNPAKYVKSQVE